VCVSLPDDSTKNLCGNSANNAKEATQLGRLIVGMIGLEPMTFRM
jgi:hypothetical protein